MNSTHPQHKDGHARAWRTLLVVAALGAATTLPTAAAAADPTPPEGAMLSGPTGVRAGVPLGDPAAPADAATIPPFDTFGRDPVLSVFTRADEGWASWRIEAVPAADIAASPVSLATGVAEVPLESIDLAAPAPGDWLLTAVLVAGAGGTSGTWAWHLVIPDRSLPAAMPAPDLVLFGGGETVVTERGSGCYLGTCGDIGQVPPAETLPLVRLDRPDEPVALTLSDGSSIASVHVTATLLGVDEAAPVTVLSVDRLATSVVLVPSPGAGRWLLDVTVQFSDGRGDQTGYARVSVPGS